MNHQPIPVASLPLTLLLSPASPLSLSRSVMSSLSSQLNALRGQKTARATHSSAVGRGFGYTNNAAASSPSKSALFKATIVHESSKVAADVPTSLVRAKCYDVLKGLRDLSLTLASYAEIIAGPSTANQERGENSPPR